MPRPVRVTRRVRPPVEPPYYGEGELVRERTVVTETTDPTLENDRSGLLWLLLVPAIALLLVIAYVASHRNDGTAPTQTSPGASPAASAAPQVVVNQPPVVVNQPPVVVNQAPAQQAPPAQGTTSQSSTQPSAAAPSPAAS